MKKIGLMWKDLDQESKQKYLDIAAELKANYQAQIQSIEDKAAGIFTPLSNSS